MLRTIFLILAAIFVVAPETQAELGLSTTLRDDGTVIVQCRITRKLLKKAKFSLLLVELPSGETTKIRSKRRRCKFVRDFPTDGASSYKVGVRLKNGQTTWSEKITVLGDESGFDDNTSLGELGNEEEIEVEETSDDQSESGIPTTTPLAFDFSGNCSGDAALNLLALTNAARKSSGNSQLQPDESLMKAAHFHSQQMAAKGELSHDGWYESIALFGFHGVTAGQNVAMNHETPQSALQAFMDSPTHRNNIMSGKFSRIGVGCFEDSSGRRWWTQDFGG